MYPSLKKEGAGFTTIVENLIQFEEIECLSFSLERLDGQGNGIGETLKWNHEQAYSKTILQQAEKRKYAECMEAGQKRLRFTTTFTESKSFVSFAEKTALQNSFMKQLL